MNRICLLGLMTFAVSLYADTPCSEWDFPQERERCRNYEATYQRQRQLQDEITWFLESEKPKKPTDDEKEESQYVYETHLRQHQDKTKQIQEALEAFFALREKFSDVCDSPPDTVSSTFNGLIGSSIGLEMTDWFASYVEDKLFPSDWKIRFDEYLKEKAAH
jgi:hypothetical protein